MIYKLNQELGKITSACAPYAFSIKLRLFSGYTVYQYTAKLIIYYISFV